MTAQIILFILGVLFIVFGVIGQKKRTEKLNSGDFKEINSKCVDFKEEWSTDSEGISSLTYYPIFEYEVDGNKYKYVGKVGTGSRKGLGKEKVLLYNDKNPGDCLSPTDKSNIVMIIIGIILLIIMLAITLIK